MGDEDKEPIDVVECNQHHPHNFYLGRDVPASALSGFIAGVLTGLIALVFVLYFLSVSNIQ